ncbi:MAG: BLUF domain-containing protein [Pseudotabrizicola sp.]|uniref:BLUF domain-containing protein n=1 Tax=Pseudotabrizicola sp. TaxID=2939647 RepID=UPI0027234BB6|nr:BLUF domain-containing protein [Pseudotabrizicola sp.]MDO8883766.1 BLUF domain-containing protein [Pseudotabrizicola sp.]MDP2079964.1 BLUF domain-containing protein [Pseudotabrizicola sp.]MDZ7575408.1 BLUF domain-containing protein [Pseudotabrizicola sp.]
MPLLQLVYASRPFGFDAVTLTAILFDARRCNTRDGITGALMCRDDLFLQLLEGPEAAVEAAYARIRADDRHVEVRELLRREIGDDQRMFAEWAMKDDPATSLVWSREEVAAGVPEQAGEAAVLAVFARLAG